MRKGQSCGGGFVVQLTYWSILCVLPAGAQCGKSSGPGQSVTGVLWRMKEEGQGADHSYSKQLGPPPRTPMRGRSCFGPDSGVFEQQPTLLQSGIHWWFNQTEERAASRRQQKATGANKMQFSYV